MVISMASHTVMPKPPHMLTPRHSLDLTTVAAEEASSATETAAETAAEEASSATAMPVGLADAGKKTATAMPVMLMD